MDPHPRHLTRALATALTLLAVVAGSLALVSPAEARAKARTSVAGWSTTNLALEQGQERDLRLVVRSTARSGRSVSLQARNATTSWTTVDRARSSRSGAVTLDVPTAAPYDGSLRVVVIATRRARGVVTSSRTLRVATVAPVPIPTPTPTPTPAPSPTPVPAGTMNAAEAEVLRLVNQARAVSRQCGATTYRAVGPLRPEPRLTLASRGHALDMGERGYFAHDSADGRTPWDRARAAGYTTASGENVAAGYRTPAEVVQGWLRSTGHCQNLMAPAARDLGVGLAEVVGSPYRYYWVQMFGRG